TSVQDVDYTKLRERLLADKQVLDWTGPRPTPPIDPKKLPGIVQDDEQAEKRGEWSKSNSIGGYIGTQYLHDNNDHKGELSVTFKLPLSKPGTYEVRLAYTANPNRATNVPVTIHHATGESVVTVNQKKDPADKIFQSLGKYAFDKEAIVAISNAKTDGYVIVDAVQILPVDAK
ncbi:MAG TPA: FAD-dependent oxidoreductase, partial [Pirellulaceae bacterium]|nr:FAD-dependent oxidoreductase [Pirellulaceae bacterium]